MYKDKNKHALILLTSLIDSKSFIVSCTYDSFLKDDKSSNLVHKTNLKMALYETYIIQSSLLIQECYLTRVTSQSPEAANSNNSVWP